MIFVEDHPDNADSKGDRSNESANHLTRDCDCDPRFVSVFVDDRDAGYPLAQSSPENPSWNDEVSENDENVDDACLNVRNVEDALTAAKNRSDYEDHHQQDTDVDGEGIGTAQRSREL